MKKISIASGIIIYLYLGAAWHWSPRHPVYSSVNKVREGVLSYHQSHNAVPEDLSFLQDKKLKEEIRLFQITWDPETRRIQSKGNWTYEPDLRYRLTFGLFGDPRARSHGDPGVDLSDSFPNFPMEPPFKKVLEALKVGMTKSQALAAIEATAKIGPDSFKIDKSLDRPETGWRSDRRLSIDLDWRAGLAEKRMEKKINTVEYFPITQGNYDGELYLYYGTDGLLAAGQLLTLRNNHIESEEFL